MLVVGGEEEGLGADRGAVDSEGEVEVGAGGVGALGPPRRSPNREALP